MKQSINWGVLGDAGIAKKAVIPAIKRANNANILAISSQKGAPKQTAVEFNIPKAYSSYEELLTDPEIDAVYIPLPNALHKKWVVEAALNGKHILCEKPAALNSKEAEEMLAVCDQQGVKFMEAFMYQFHPQHTRVKEIINSGEIGTVKQMNSAFTYLLDLTAKNIRLNAQLGGGSLYDVGCYCIHSILSILEMEPLSVYCRGNIDEESQVDLTVQGTMTFPDQVIATFSSSLEQYPVNQYEVIGTKGKIIITQAFRPDKQGGEGKLIVVTQDGTREENFVADQYRAQIEHFSNAILKEENLNESNQHTLKNMRVMDACFRSLCEKKSVEVL
ncbi:Gfo/Idh/MocA family protein [Alkalihalobacterium chitinilyticum]|uniref:Gfo/Idh/MocA family oxidoreductase n=1 Tax=Alkalihalobacterium chitinilyticum TaxID=2980103 RepID=A0ABT5VL16_9BACI|nr:Gfo/Idh/MocA family oxidoreductase [Alkalihalobacterium chitinilyticum]MDE5416109.1 Gfo/Idh/MocA family oxidoreductase [Alkalihalobacterium chitinilyticum]